MGREAEWGGERAEQGSNKAKEGWVRSGKRLGSVDAVAAAES